MVQKVDRERLRLLATKWMEFASKPIMKDRKRQWKAVKDLKSEKPMILVETCMLTDFISQADLVCQDPYLRNVEKYMLETVRHGEEIHDDIVFEPYLRIQWDVEVSDYGVPIEAHHAQDTGGGELGYSFNFPISSPDDFSKLHLRSRKVIRSRSFQRKELLESIFGDILPVKISGYDFFFQDPGYNPFLGNMYGGLTMDLFKLIGNNNLLYWVYDEPEFIHQMMNFLCEDRLEHYRWIEKESLLFVNTDTYNSASGTYCYVSDLEAKENQEIGLTLKDCWCWADSQETAMISPEMFKEFFLPYIAKVTNQFGLLYYGCCEALHDRIESVAQAMPNLRAISVSGWSDPFKMAEFMGKRYVYSRKPTPAYISGVQPNWDLLKNDLERTIKAAKDLNLELCFRDIYTINGDVKRLDEWVTLARRIIG